MTIRREFAPNTSMAHMRSVQPFLKPVEGQRFVEEWFLGQPGATQPIETGGPRDQVETHQNCTPSAPTTQHRGKNLSTKKSDLPNCVLLEALLIWAMEWP